MGILDDAIREHLELKRRAGADPGDIARLEREAFGPGESAAPPVAEAAVAEAAETAAPPPEEPAAEVEPAAVAAEPEPVEPVEPELESSPEPPLDQPTRQFTVEELEEAERAHPPAPVEPEAAPQPAADPGEHDELEETPEFLQETPEHDRLWFEQKPPKDFDF